MRRIAVISIVFTEDAGRNTPRDGDRYRRTYQRYLALERAHFNLHLRGGGEGPDMSN